MNTINPKVSLWTKHYFPKKNESLNEIDLYTVLKYCVDIDNTALKGQSGSIFPYLSSTLDSSDKYSDGVLFIDFDHCSDVANQIYESFDNLCQTLPNILGVNFSYSGNLHFYIYDFTVKENPSLYSERNTFWMCCLSQCIKKVTGIDLRNIEGCMDPHSKYFSQRLFLAKSEFKWNVYCTHTIVSKSDIKRLKSEYHKWFNFNTMKSCVIELPPLEFSGTISVDSSFFINTQKGPVSGWEARTVIVASTYHHFNCDLDATVQYICNRYINCQDMCEQLKSMVSTGSVNFLWDSTTERILFPKPEGIVLQYNEYLSDVLDLDEELKNNRYLYICSNTGTGKTELVKKFMRDHPERKVVYVQMMKSILSGKVDSIEDLTVFNTDYVENIEDRNQIHLTIDKTISTFKGIDPKNYTVFVDESHLLEDHIGFRISVIKTLCQILAKSLHVIFLSATPKSDIRLLDFKILNYTKIQDQTLLIRQIPIMVRGRKSSDAIYFDYMIKDIEKRTRNRHVTIFTNKKEDKWLDYGLINKDVTRFRADFPNDKKVLSVLKDNRICTKWCLATSYMSVGVEVKHGRHTVVFDIHEGIDISHIIQSIGRFRPGYISDLEVLIYYKMGKMPYRPIKTDVISNLDNIWNHLIVETDIGNVANILSSKLLKISDVNFPVEATDMIRILKLSNLRTCIDFYSPHSYQILKSLPYKKVAVVNESKKELSSDNSVARCRREDELIDYLKSCTNRYVSMLGESEGGYETLWNSGILPYNDKVAARKIIRKCKYIVNMGLPLSKTIDFFCNDVNEAYEWVLALKDYIRLNRGERVIVDFVGSQKTRENLEMKQKVIKELFTKEFLNWCVKSEKVNLFIDITSEDQSLEILNSILNLDAHEDSVEIEFFKGNNSKECMERISKKEMCSFGGKISSPKKAISLIDPETSEMLHFDSKGECMQFLKISPRTFSKFVKGNTIRGCKWQIASNMVA